MPRTSTTIFKVRYYECDAYGHVNNHNYLNYMQEAAFNASTEAGYGLDEYDNLGHVWLPRQKQVEFFKPIKYGDTFEITTYVKGFRRVRSTRVYEFRFEDSDEIIARGETDWIYINSETQRPTRIPEEMMAAFFPEGLPEETAQRDPFPEVPPAPKGAVTVNLKVSWNEIDPMQHVNNAKYLSYLENAGIVAISQYGWPMERTLEMGYGWVARKLRIEYLLQAKLNDELEITTYLSERRSASVMRDYFIRFAKSGELICQAKIQWAFIDLNTEKPTRIPQEMLADLAGHIVEEDG